MTLIFAFVTLLIGVSLLTPVASEGLQRTSLVTTTNESVSIGTARNIAGDGRSLNSSIVFTVANEDWTNGDCQMTDIIVGNSTGLGAFVDGTDYNFTESTGKFVLYNTSKTWADTTNTSKVTYTYCPEGYVNLAWGRTVIGVVPGFFAIALLMVSVGLFYSFYLQVKD
jgi:hypothetical protein